MSSKVSVHWNRHLKCWSVRQGRAGVQHVETFSLRNVTFKVSEVGRQRAIKEGHRNVHAFARGSPDNNPVPSADCVRVRYNPFKSPTFTQADTNEPVHRAATANFLADGTVWVSPN